MERCRGSFCREKEEKELFAAFSELSLDSDKSFAEKIAELVDFCGFIELFFEKIMVNAEDEKLRLNRWNLLAEIRRSIRRVIDLSQIEAGDLK